MSQASILATLRTGAAADAGGLAPSWLRSGRWLALLVFAFYLGLFLMTLRFAPLSPVASVDEQLNYYQIARSFVRYGFLNSGLLQDLSTSSNAAHHPYVYDHMPPGPEIFIALFFKAFGEQFALLRLVFAMLFLLGMVYFFRFARLIFERQGLGGEGYAVLFLSGGLVLHTMDHPAHSLSPFFAFFPIVALDRYYRTGKRRHYSLAVVAILAASMYTVTTVFVSLLIGWAMLSALRLVRIDRRHLAVFVAVGVSGILLHLLQAMLFLGPAVFFQELSITISNRVFGVPSADAVTAFYRTHDIVLNGLHSVDPSRLIKSLNQSFRFPGRAFVVVLGVVLLLWQAVGLVRVRRATGVPPSGPRPSSGGALGWLVKLALAMTAVIVPTFVMFPAYAADYGLGGLNELLLAIVATAVVACAVREVVGRASSASPVLELVGRGLVAMALVASLAALVRTQAINLTTITRTTLAPNPYAELAAIGERLHGRIVMTNAYPITAGFFTQEASFGGCGPAAFGPDGSVDPSRCHAAFIRGYARTTPIRPTHFLLFRGLYVDFSRCTGDCIDTLYQRVAAHHPPILETGLFTIFALKER